MSTLHRLVETADKLDKEWELFRRMQEVPVTAETAPEHLAILLSQAKSVRRHSTLLVRAVAAFNEALQRHQDAQGELK
jgi:hypothetical protein